MHDVSRVQPGIDAATDPGDGDSVFPGAQELSLNHDAYGNIVFDAGDGFQITTPHYLTSGFQMNDQHYLTDGIIDVGDLPDGIGPSGEDVIGSSGEDGIGSSGEDGLWGGLYQ